MTADEFFALGEAPFRYQLVDGALVVNEPTLPHQFAAKNILFALDSWTRGDSGRGLASMPADFRFDDRNIYAPDVWWVGEGRKPARGDLYLRGLPDLIVEVRSPSTWHKDLGRKKLRYEAAGVAELWFVDTEADTVLVFRRSSPDCAAFDVDMELGEGDTLTSPLLPGFALPVEDVFRI